jgi:hypothetical protein
MLSVYLGLLKLGQVVVDEFYFYFITNTQKINYCLVIPQN